MEEIIQESYYGKLPEFDELENLFDRINAKAKKVGYTKSNPNKMPEHKKIEKIFTKLFGFKKTLIYWEPYSAANAYTLSLNTYMVFTDKKKSIVKRDGKGFYDSSHSIVLTVYISVGLLTTGLTSRELIAVILHEIGHNFDYSVWHKLEGIIYSIMSLGLTALDIYQNKDRTNDIKEDFYLTTKQKDDKVYKNQKTRDRIDRQIEDAERTSYKIGRVLDGILFIPLAPVYLICAPLSMIMQMENIAGKKGELFADSFATAYGYGPELITALNRFENIKPENKPKGKISKFFFDLGKIHEEILQAFSGEVHGSNMERCQECIEKLKYDLRKNDFPPEMKEVLVEEINSLTRLYKQFYKFDKNEQEKVTKCCRRILAVLFHGKPNITKFFKRHKV